MSSGECWLDTMLQVRQEAVGSASEGSLSMWVSQTYLGFSGTDDTRYYIYFLFEGYKSGQDDFRKTIIDNLSRLGQRTGHASAIFVPQEDAEEYIRKELKAKFQRGIWEKIHTHTPGLFFCSKPMQDLDPENDKWVYVALKALQLRRKEFPELVPEYFRLMENIIEESNDLIWEMANIKTKNVGQKLKEMLAFKPKFGGIEIDFSRFDDPYVESRNVFS